MNKNYYDLNAKKYFVNAFNLDLSDLYSHFLPLVKENGYILDVGAGSRRDSYQFKKRGVIM